MFNDFYKDVKKEQQDKFWIEYYNQFNIEYKPSNNLFIRPMYRTIYWDELTDLDYRNKSLMFLLEEFDTITKNTVSFSCAYNYWGDKLKSRNLECTFEVIKDAYTIAYGNGSEYEFEEY